jgi:small subunit ribosomal protein S4
MGMAKTRKEARQLVRHNHFLVNGKKANIPSILVRVGDTVTVAETSKDSEKFKALAEIMNSRISPKWLEVDKQNATAKVVALPQRDDIEYPVEEQLVVELYSK